MVNNNIKQYLAEAIGTFALVFFGTGAIVVNEIFPGSVTNIGISLVFGLAVVAVIYAIGSISGAHIHPAVTVGFCFTRNFPAHKAVFYVVWQILGALAASVVLRLLFIGHATLGATLPRQGFWQSAVLEFLLTFFLMFVILQVSGGVKEEGFPAGIAIGGTVALEALFAGPISGASMNPARSLAPALVSNNLHGLWIYILAPISGAIVACLISKFILSKGDSLK